MKVRYDKELQEKVKLEIKNGLTVKEAVKKYNISKYYATLWTKKIYSDMDIDNYVRKRYQYLASARRDEMEYQLGMCMTEEESNAISEETWEKIDGIIKHYMYEFAKDIVRAN